MLKLGLQRIFSPIIIKYCQSLVRTDLYCQGPKLTVVLGKHVL